jgi:hypothetical protein
MPLNIQNYELNGPIFFIKKLPPVFHYSNRKQTNTGTLDKKLVVKKNLRLVRALCSNCDKKVQRSMVVHVYNPRTQDAEAGEWQV